MTVIDPSTPIGKIRLRTGDWADLVILPDEVIQSALEDCNDHIPRAAALCAQYILATLTAKTHRRISQVESWSNEHFDNYVKFLKLTVLNPNLMSTAPIPYGGDADKVHPLVAFQEEWNKAYCSNTTSTF